MRRSILLVPAIGFLVALTACSRAGDQDGDPSAEMAVQDSSASSPSAADNPATLDATGNGQAIPVSLPKMAYVYDLAFTLPDDEIGETQQRHADMCEAMGPYSCQIISMQQSGEDDGPYSGQLELAVLAGKARAFSKSLTGVVDEAGGEPAGSTITGEDLSKSIVDTEARLRSRTALRDRLLEVLRTRNGKVSELVEAERSVAQVNEEIDQTRAWLEEMRGRVAFSRMTIAYSVEPPLGASFLAPVSGAVSALGTILGSVLAVAIVLGAIGAPLALLAWLIMRIRRRLALAE